MSEPQTKTAPAALQTDPLQNPLAGTEATTAGRDKNPAIMAQPGSMHTSSAYAVQEDPEIKGTLLFNPLAVVPPEQEIARQQLEEVAMVLRSVFQQKYPDLFREYFVRLLALGSGTFSTDLFRPESLSDIPQFKRELVYRAGALVQGKYNSHLALAVVWAVLLILICSTLLQFAASAWRTQIVASAPNDGSSSVTTSTFSIAGLLRSLGWDKSTPILHLGVLLSAAMVGLLFASMSRNTTPSFDLLMRPEADLMKPWVRLLFFGIAILAIALIFEAQIVTVKFGSSFSTDSVGADALTAVIVGLLLGVAERALPNEVERWSQDLLTAARRTPTT